MESFGLSIQERTGVDRSIDELQRRHFDVLRRISTGRRRTSDQEYVTFVVLFSSSVPNHDDAVIRPPTTCHGCHRLFSVKTAIMLSSVGLSTDRLVG